LAYTDEQENSNTAYSDQENIEVLNSYFVSSFIFDMVDGDYDVDYLLFQNKNKNSPRNINIVESEVVDILRLIPPNKANGPNKVRHRILKSRIYSVSTCKPLTVFYNIS